MTTTTDVTEVCIECGETLRDEASIESDDAYCDSCNTYRAQDQWEADAYDRRGER
jgi:hypothetical protein